MDIRHINECGYFCFVFRLIQPICLGGFVSYFAQSEGEAKISQAEAYW